MVSGPCRRLGSTDGFTIVALVHKTPYVELYQSCRRTLLRPSSTSLLFFLETEQNDRSPKLRVFIFLDSTVTARVRAVAVAVAVSVMVAAITVAVATAALAEASVGSGGNGGRGRGGSGGRGRGGGRRDDGGSG